MQCREARERIADLLLGECPPQARLQLDEHLESCEECRAAADDAGEGLAVLQDFAAAEVRIPPPPANLAGIFRHSHIDRPRCPWPKGTKK